MITMDSTTNGIVKTPMRKQLTVKELHLAERGKHFFMKGDNVIFPINGKFAVSIKGMAERFNFKDDEMPVLDDVRTAHLLIILGKDGWDKCHFEQ